MKRSYAAKPNKMRFGKGESKIPYSILNYFDNSKQTIITLTHLVTVKDSLYSFIRHIPGIHNRLRNTATSNLKNPELIQFQFNLFHSNCQRDCT